MALAYATVHYRWIDSDTRTLHDQPHPHLDGRTHDNAGRLFLPDGYGILWDVKPNLSTRREQVGMTLLATLLCFPQAAPGQGSSRAAHREAELFHVFNRADSVVRATVQKGERSPSAAHKSGIDFTARIAFTEEVPIKGERPNIDRFVIPSDMPLPAGLTSGDQLLIASSREILRPRYRVEAFERATRETIALFERATSVPFGWNLQRGRPTSPWTLARHASFELGRSLDRYTACAVSGRPAFLTPPEIRLEAHAILPRERSAGINPYGDGMFSVQVTNTGVTTQQIQSLRQRNGTLLWNESLVVDFLGAAYVFSPSGSIDNTQPVRLAPGETVQGTINLLALSTLPWPTESGIAPLRLALGNTVIPLHFHYDPIHHGRRLR